MWAKGKSAYFIALWSPDKNIKGNHYDCGNGHDPQGDLRPISGLAVLFYFKHD
jgi:hypothetical protein